MINFKKAVIFAALIVANVFAFSGGNGSAADPFIISTAEHLNAVRNNLTAHYRLANNITIAGEWTPIPEFQGTFDGNGRAISGIVINSTSADDNLGFFGFIGNSGVVQNLSVDVDIFGNNLAGALAAVNRGTIEKVRASGRVVAPIVGGLVAENRGTIRNFHSTALVVPATLEDNLPAILRFPLNPNEGDVFAFNTHGISMEFVYVSPGTFMFGACASTTPATVGTSHIITQGFWIGKYPITQAQYQAVMTGHPILSATPSNFNGRSDNPVEQVSWADITFVDGFLERIGARLPTEHEWEFAARGGNRRGGNNGRTDFIWAGSNTANEVAWYGQYIPTASTQPVGGLAPNELGIHDMSGNVWEWTSTFAGSNRTIRGGCWEVGAATAVRIVHRTGIILTSRNRIFGFRVAFSSDLNIPTTTEQTTAATSQTTLTNTSTGGSLVGVNFGTIENSYFTGRVNIHILNGVAGGLVGTNQGTITNSFFDSQRSGQSDNDGRGAPLNTNQMRIKNSFVGWDFNEIWGISQIMNDGFPYLRQLIDIYEEHEPVSITIDINWDGNETFVFTYNGEEQGITAIISNADDRFPVTISNNTRTNVGAQSATADLTTQSPNVILQNATREFTINYRNVDIIWNGDFISTYDREEKRITATSNDVLFPTSALAITNNTRTNVGTQTATAALTTPNPNVILQNASRQFTINRLNLTVEWGNAEVQWNDRPQTPTASSGNENFPLTTTGHRTVRGNGTATAQLATADTNVILHNTTTPFEIVRRPITVEWDKEAQLVFNKRPQAPDVSATFERNGETVDVELVIWTGERGTAAGRHIFIVMAANENVRDNVELSNNIIDYQIQRRPLDVVVGNTNADVNTARDTIVVTPSLFDNRETLENLILSLVEFDNFATDENGISDDRSILRGNPRVSINPEPLPAPNPYPAPRSLDLLRYRIYLLTINTGDMTADNYRISDTTFVIRTTDYVPSFIRNRQTNDSRFGIVLENAVVSDFAKISVITPETATINLRIMDNLGNVVFATDNVRAGFKPAPTADGAIVWNLQNFNGRLVANGTYLIIVEATGISGRRYLYSSRIGINR